MTRRPRPGPAQQGFTLTELLAVVVIIALLAAVAVPALTRDDEDARFEKMVKQFVSDVRRAHMRALSTREAQSLMVQFDGYTLDTVIGSTHTTVETREAPTAIWIADITAQSAMPGTSYTKPALGAQLSGTVEIRFLGTGQVLNDVGGGQPVQQATSVFFQSSTGKERARVVIFPTTAYAERYEGW